MGVGGKVMRRFDDAILWCMIRVGFFCSMGVGYHCFAFWREWRCFFYIEGFNDCVIDTYGMVAS